VDCKLKEKKAIRQHNVDLVGLLKELDEDIKHQTRTNNEVQREADTTERLNKELQEGNRNLLDHVLDVKRQIEQLKISHADTMKKLERDKGDTVRRIEQGMAQREKD